jgi:Skp family chaperone for outer membrane proteins
MKTLFKPGLALGLILAAVASPAALAQTRPAAPTAPTGTMVPGMGVANVDAVIANSDAYRAAGQQRPATYKATYDQAQARARVLDAELKPLIDRFNADRAAKKPDALLQQQYLVIQQRQEAAKEEIQTIMLPVALSEAFVIEQLEAKLDQAIRTAMTKGRVTMLLSPQAVVATENAYNLTPAIISEINALLPTAQLVPPQGWEPRQIREARAAQAAAAGAPATAPAAGTPTPTPAPVVPRAPAGPQPDGR